jgi:hypothetical protein
VILLSLDGGKEKIEGAADRLTKERDQDTDEEAW